MSDTVKMRILLRAAKSPFRIATARETLSKNLIGTNSGNLIFSHAAARILSTSQAEVLPNIFNPTAEVAGVINERYDHFVIPLANAFRPDFIKHLDGMSDCIKRLNIPVTVFGVGAQAVGEGDIRELAPLNASVKRFVAAVLDRSASIGVRGEFTATFLKSLGFSSSQVEIIGCPSMFLTDGVTKVPQRAPFLHANSHIAINLSPHVQGVRELAERHRRSYRHINYIAQDLRDLRMILQRERGASPQDLATAPITPNDPIFAPNTASFYLDPHTWIRDMKNFDVAFGTRIHGNIAALLAGRPAFVLAHDSRTLELARYFEIPYRDVSGPDGVGWVSAAEIFDGADYAPMVKNHAGRLRATLTFLERNGLHHSYAPGESAAEFDATIADLMLPAAVRAISRPRAVYEAVLRKIRRTTSRISGTTPMAEPLDPWIELRAVAARINDNDGAYPLRTSDDPLEEGYAARKARIESGVRVPHGHGEE